MIGIQNVNNIITLYQILTLFFLFLFAIYDQRHHLIRNTALLAFLCWCLLGCALQTMNVPPGARYLPVLKSLAGFIAGFSVLFCVAIITSGGIGGGDIKLVAVLGIPFGAMALMQIVMIACLLAILIYTICAHTKKMDVNSLPFAPYLFGGCLFYFLVY